MSWTDSVIEKRRTRAARGPYPLLNFYGKLSRATKLLLYAEQATGPDARMIKSEARRQFIIALVSAFEVYLGDLVIELIDSGKVTLRDGLAENLKKKYGIAELRDILNNSITLGEIVCEQINFQNMDESFSFLSSLFECDFPELVKENKFSYKTSPSTTAAISLRRDFPRTLSRILMLRHRQVHDFTFQDTPSLEQLYRYRKLTHHLATCVDVQADQLRGITSSVIIPK